MEELQAWGELFESLPVFLTVVAHRRRAHDEHRRLSADRSVQFFLLALTVFLVLRLEDCGLTAEKKYNQPLLVLSMQTISNWRVFVFVQVNCELKQVN